MKIKKVEELVMEVLVNYPSTRGDDWKLVAYVYNNVCPEIKDYKFNEVMLGHSELKLPPVESITRARRKIQEKMEELRAEERIQKERKKKEEEFINYARGNEEAIYEKYCKIYPEKITSDFTLENVENIEEFINDYMEEI